MNKIENSLCVINIIILGVPALSLEKLMMDCSYVHGKSCLKNVCVREKINLFRAVTSNLCMNQNVVGSPW